jgi:hypothetical protein
MWVLFDLFFMFPNSTFTNYIYIDLELDTYIWVVYGWCENKDGHQNDMCWKRRRTTCS